MSPYEEDQWIDDHGFILTFLYYSEDDETYETKWTMRNGNTFISISKSITSVNSGLIDTVKDALYNLCE